MTEYEARIDRMASELKEKLESRFKGEYHVVYGSLKIYYKDFVFDISQKAEGMDEYFFDGWHKNKVLIHQLINATYPFRWVENQLSLYLPKAEEQMRLF